MLLQPNAEQAVVGSINKPTKYRIVIDTNVLISAMIYGGRPEQVLRHVLASHTLILSDYIVDEFVAYLKVARPKLPQKWMRGIREQLQRYCYDEGYMSVSRLRDMRDDPVLGLALSYDAIIVTGDKDLLEYRDSSQTAIISTADYLELLGGQ